MKVSRKIKKLVYIALFPPVIVVFALALWFVISSQIRERDNWEAGTATSLELMAASSTIKTYAEYRSYGLAQEAEVYTGFIGDNLLILSSSFIERTEKLPGIYFIDSTNRSCLGITENSVRTLEAAELEDIVSRVSAMPPGGMARPGMFASDDYRFSRKTEYSGQEIFLFMEIPNPFRGSQLFLLAACFLFPLSLLFFIMQVTGMVRKAIGKIADPVERLTELAKEVMTGNPEVRALHETDDEIGDLADAFNRMLDRLSLSLHEKTRILESITDGFVAIDADWNLTYVNEEAEHILGSSRENIIGKKNWDVFPFTVGTDIEAFYRNVMETRKGGELEYFNTFKDQWFNRWIAIKASPVENGGISVYIKDITERKEAENSVKASLRQKEMLLHEIHHRVKNNLQIVSSLVDLQSMLHDDADSAPSEAFKNRIRAMSEIYECISESEDFSSIDFHRYSESLTLYLFMFYRSRFDSVSFEIAEGNVRLDMNQAFPCGLILNEIISNAFRHGFPRDLGRPGLVKISLREIEASCFELTVEDNGIGLPEGVDLSSTAGMGLPLVSILAKQLEGKIEISRQSGTGYRLRFGKYSGARISGGLALLRHDSFR